MLEVDLWADAIGPHAGAAHLHFGGGSPNALSPDDFRKLVRHMTARFALRPGAEVAAELDAYNATAAELCTRHGVAFVDITGTSRAHAADASMLVDDGLHPSASMYALWAERALPVARGLLGHPQ